MASKERRPVSRELYVCGIYHPSADMHAVATTSTHETDY